MRRFSLLLVACLVGCGGTARDPREKPVFPVRGQVLVDGQPAATARVMLVPVGSTAADNFTPHPYGRVQDDGSFRITTYRANDGAPAGEYVVTVVWAREKVPGSRERGPDLLRGRYANPRSSPLRVQITEGDNDLQPFRLRLKGNTRASR